MPRWTVKALLLSSAIVVAAAVSNGSYAASQQIWSFEAGLDPGFAVFYRAADYADQPTVDALDPRPRVEIDAGARAAELGERFLAIDPPARARAILHTPTVKFSGDRAITFSVFLRSDPPGTATLRILEPRSSGGTAAGARVDERASSSVHVDRAWRRYSVTAASRLALGDALVVGEIAVGGARHVGVDGVQIDAGARATPLRKRVEMIVELVGDEEHGVVVPGDAQAVVTVSRAPERGDRLSVTVEDFRGHAVAATPEKPGKFSFRAETLGPSRFRAELRDHRGKLLAETRRAFVVLPPPARVRADLAVLGTHAPLSDRFLRLAARLDLRRLRLHDASFIGQWLTVEPRPGERHFFDEEIDRARSLGFDLLGVLGATPRWASSAPPDSDAGEARAFLPSDPRLFERYAESVVSHERGRVSAWELWNEPYYPEFFQGGPVEYLALAAGAARAAKNVDSDETLLFAACGDAGCRAWDGDGRALTGLATLRPTHFSTLAFHLYDRRLYAPRDETPAERVSHIRAQSSSTRLWQTEGTAVGASRPFAPEAMGDPDAEHDAAAFVRFAVDTLAAGVERVYVYALVPSQLESDSDIALLDADGTPRPGAAALAVLAARLDGKTFREAIGDEHIFAAAGGRGSVAITYRSDLSPFAARGDGDLDVFGNALLVGQPARLAYRRLDGDRVWSSKSPRQIDIRR